MERVLSILLKIVIEKYKYETYLVLVFEKSYYNLYVKCYLNYFGRFGFLLEFTGSLQKG